MPHKIEEAGFTHLIKRIQDLGKSVLRRNGTFDLSVDEKDAELKAKGDPFHKIDFITFTEKQYEKIKNGSTFDIFIVCGVKGDNPEIYCLSSEDLRTVKPRENRSYEYSRTLIKDLVEKM